MIGNNIFFATFLGMFSAIMKIFIVAFIGGILVRKKIISQQTIKALSDVTIKIFLPSLIFSNIISTFDPSKISHWWILPLVGFFYPLILMSITSVFYFSKIKKNLSKFPLSSFQNAGYLVLPIGQLLFPDNFQKFALYVFLLLLGFNPTLWSIGKIFITQTDQTEKIKFKNIITPPLIANLFGLSLVFIGVNHFVPNIIYEPIRMLGTATVPIAIFILGATLGSVSFRLLPKFADIFKLSFVKLILSPTIMILLLLSTSIYHSNHLMADFLVIEASAAPAANLIVIVRKYGGNTQTTGSLMLIMYSLAIFLMPFWIALWRYLS